MITSCTKTIEIGINRSSDGSFDFAIAPLGYALSGESGENFIRDLSRFIRTEADTLTREQNFLMKVKVDENGRIHSFSLRKWGPPGQGSKRGGFENSLKAGSTIEDSNSNRKKKTQDGLLSIAEFVLEREKAEEWLRNAEDYYNGLAKRRGQLFSDFKLFKEVLGLVIGRVWKPVAAAIGLPKLWDIIGKL